MFTIIKTTLLRGEGGNGEADTLLMSVTQLHIAIKSVSVSYKLPSVVTSSRNYFSSFVKISKYK